jgi:hypothetical protein
MGEWANKEVNRGQNFEQLGGRARRAVWYAFYDAAPAAVCQQFWSPVQAVIDWNQIFNLDPALPDENKAKLKGVRNMLRHKFLFAFEETFRLIFLEVTPGEPNIVEEVKISGSVRSLSLKNAHADFNKRSYSAIGAHTAPSLPRRWWVSRASRLPRGIQGVAARLILDTTSTWPIMTRLTMPNPQSEHNICGALEDI